MDATGNFPQMGIDTRLSWRTKVRRLVNLDNAVSTTGGARLRQEGAAQVFVANEHALGAAGALAERKLHHFWKHAFVDLQFTRHAKAMYI